MAFYDRMADTATRLLTKFGRPVTFERVTSVFNPITGMDTSRTTATTDTVGVEIPINKALIDGTRVQVGDKFIVIDASFEPMMSDRLMVGLNPPIVSYAYPLDATLAEIQALDPGVNAVPVMTDALQTGTLTIQGGLGSNWETVAAPTLTPPGPATALFDTGVKKFEWAYTMPNLTGAAVSEDLGWMYLGLFYVSNFADGLVHIYINTTVTAGVQLTQLKVFRLGVDVSGYITVPRTGNIAVVLDANTATFSVEINSGPVTLSDDTYTIANPCILSMNLSERYGVEAEHAGKTMSASLVTDLAQMLYPLPDGATDICGNTLSKDISDSWAIVAIESINPAGTPVAYRVQVRK